MKTQTMNSGKLNLLIQLINEEKTGNSEELGRKLGLAKRTVYTYLQVLRSEFKAPIDYSKERKTFYFTEKGELNLHWQEKK